MSVPYKIVRKLVHGVMFDVKVYPPRSSPELELLSIEELKDINSAIAEAGEDNRDFN